MLLSQTIAACPQPAIQLRLKCTMRKQAIKPVSYGHTTTEVRLIHCSRICRNSSNATGKCVALFSLRRACWSPNTSCPSLSRSTSPVVCSQRKLVLVMSILRQCWPHQLKSVFLGQTLATLACSPSDPDYIMTNSSHQLSSIFL